ncbi:carotenoid biosynthesis protein [Candidatus Lucifugimonas marina]|uniref:Carotenoid biosynthesis protein n=1 Tax=Candidatus Lucifugimonas marina TaxID=3038979 RepID=A0AAJ5ZG50_9CHLR|nr:carotenoid biosynthesis protein [SAR202 cluster bacterium JH702]MDG0869231.1 carotenoid biosynthesis protein [SAR202 cluster bacterium JH639]WFG36636.1 carotenoid biosynthesis protein [SAR202 cluster bacterium JH545]WFG40569.1 carotenoid biosynthesis protein [SAR202 cluster bacterium JH1073]
MSRIVNIFFLVSTGLYAVLWFGGVVSSALWDEAPDGTGWAAPAFLYLASIIVIVRVKGRNRLLFYAIGLYGFVAEVIGESTGFPFGEYSYSDAFGPALLDVPIALASAWIVVTAFAVNVLQKAGVQRTWWIVAGPGVMVVIDLILEPVATGPMGGWSWQDSFGYYGVPITNFFGWFLVSLPIFGVLAMTRYSDRGGAIVSSSVIVFFLLIALINLLWWPLIITTFSLVTYLSWRRLQSHSVTNRNSGDQPNRICNSPTTRNLNPRKK